MLGSAGDWALKRLLKFVLKRSLKHVIKTELDLDQLSVQLGQGTLELREVLLNTDYLNEHLAGVPWEVAAAFVGSVAAVIPLSSIATDSCEVRLDEVFITVRPRPLPPPQAGLAEGMGPGSPSPHHPATDWPAAQGGPTGESAVAEGVKLIAGGLEALLQRMRVVASRVVLRVEIPHSAASSSASAGISCHVVTLSLAQAEFSGRSSLGGDCPKDDGPWPAHPAPAAAQVVKCLQLSGLTLEMQQGTAGEGGPKEEEALPACSLLGGADGRGWSGTVEACLTWGLRAGARPHVSVVARLEALQLALRPEDLVAAAAVAAGVASLPAAALAQQQASAPVQAGLSAAVPEHLHPGSRSFIEGLMLPDCQGLVAEALEQGIESSSSSRSTSGGGSGSPTGRGGGEAAITGQEELDEFFDAKSLLGSIQASYASFMSAHDWLGASQSSQSSFSPQGLLPPEASLYQVHDLTASIRQLSSEEAMEWELEASTPSFNLSFLYPGTAPHTGSSPLQQPAYAPRLSVDLSQVRLAAAGGAGGVQCALTLALLQAAEHLVGPDPCRGAAEEEAGRVPCALPPLGFAARPLPSSAGSYPVPSGPCKKPLGSTLSQLSDLQAMLFQPPAQSSAADASAAPRLHILPVLSCGGGSSISSTCASSDSSRGGGAGVGPSPCALLYASVLAPGTEHEKQAQHAEQAEGASEVTLAIQPVSIWASVPFLERLRAFLEQVHTGVSTMHMHTAHGGAGGGESNAATAGGVAAPAGMPAQRPLGSASTAAGKQDPKAAVSAAIEDILHDLQGLRVGTGPGDGAAAATTPGPLRLCAFLPHACLVMAAPGAYTPPPPPVAAQPQSGSCTGSSASSSSGSVYSYLAADLGMAAQPGAAVVQGLRRLGQAPTLGEVQALVQGLASGGAAPALLLQRGRSWLPDLRSSSWGARQVVDTWDCTASLASGALYLVGSQEGGEEGSLRVESCLTAHQVAVLTPPGALHAEPAALGLVVGVQWSPCRAASPTLLEDAWRRLGQKLNPAQEPSEEQGRWESDGLHTFTFRQQCLQSSPLYVHASAPALEAALSPAALACLASLGDSLLQLAPQPPAQHAQHAQQAQQADSSDSQRVAAVQVAVEVECGAVCCQLAEALAPWGSPQGAGAPLFSFRAEGLRLMSVANLSGMPGGGAAVVSCDGMDLLSAGQPGAHSSTCYLLHRPAGAAVDGCTVPGVEIVHIARPQGGASTSSVLHPRTKRLYIPTDAQAALTVAGWTLATEGGDITLSWLQRLAGFFAGAAPVWQGPEAAGAAQPEPAGALDWVLEGSGLALRYEPPCREVGVAGTAREPVAAVLMLGSLSCSGGAGRPSLPLSLRCLAVHLAPLSGRPPRWGLFTPQHVPGLALGSEGYTCVATEGAVSISIPTAAGTSASEDLTGLEVSNHLLSIVLTQQSALMLQQLAQQCGDAARQAQGQQQAQRQGGEQQERQQQAQQQGPSPQEQATPRQQRPCQSLAAAAAQPRAAGDGVLGTARGAAAEAAQLCEEQQGGIGLFLGVQENAYRSQAQQNEQRQASVFIDGGWYEALENEPLSPAGSPPVLINDFYGGSPVPQRRGREAGSTAEDSSEGDGTWFQAPSAGVGAWPLDQNEAALSSSGSGSAGRPLLCQGPGSCILDNYLDSKEGREPPIRGHAAAKGALGPLPGGYPPPASRISLRDVNICITLSSVPPQRSGAPATVLPLSCELQLRLQRLCVQVDTFRPGHTHVCRIAASLHTLEARERRDAALGPASPAASSQHHRAGVSRRSSTSSSSSMGSSPRKPRLASLRSSLDWRQVLGCNASAGAARDPEACMAAVLVELVQPDPQGDPGGEEYRVEVALLPLRLQLDKGTVAFLQRFFAPFTAGSSLEEAAVMVEHADAEATEEEGAGPTGAAAGGQGDSLPGTSLAGFIQRCEVAPFTVTIDYQPQSVDLAALRRGDFPEILNLFPWGGVTLHFRRLHLFGVHDLSILGTALASAWLEDIVKYQAHKFLAGIAPIRSLCKVSSAALQLISIPVEHLFAESSGPPNRRSLSSLADASFLRQMRRGVLALVRAIAAEALGLGGSGVGRE